jgi:hypothetical protein
VDGSSPYRIEAVSAGTGDKPRRRNCSVRTAPGRLIFTHSSVRSPLRRDRAVRLATMPSIGTSPSSACGALLRADALRGLVLTLADGNCSRESKSR